MTAHNPEFRPLSWDDVRNAPYVDGEFTVEQEGHLADQPEWKAWLYFGAAKYTEAVRRLRYTGMADNLYHYEDRRDGQRYSLPLIERVQSHFREAKQANKHNNVVRRRWKTVWLSWAATLVLLFIIGVKSHPTENPNLANVIGMTMIILLVVGAPVIGIAHSASKRRPRPLPSHVMWYTDAELAEMERKQRQKDILIAGATAAYVAHKYHQHSQERLADLIVERQNAHDWHHPY
jgi:hypothetical protein